jgi:nucleoside-diphosphate-sugar epimerase
VVPVLLKGHHVNVFLTGGSGYIGRATIDALVARGHRVRALARSERAAATVRRHGAEPIGGALTDPGGLRRAAAGAEAVIHLAQASTPEEDLDAASAMIDGVGPGVYVHTGGTWVHGDTDGIADETAPWNPPPIVAWRRQVETAVLDRGRHAVIVRPGLVYGGENRLIDDFFARPGRETGAVPYIGDGTNNWALVHVADVATLYAAALDARAGSVYLGVGGIGPTAREVAELLGRGSTISLTLRQARERMGPIADAFALDQRFSAARARDDLGWRPIHDDPLKVLADT